MSNSLGKVLNIILCNRGVVSSKAYILSPAQAGFRKDHRTSDYIVTLYKKACHKEQISIYLLCWLSESTRFNSEGRTEDKQEKNGINGKCLDIFDAMYLIAPNISLKYKNKVTEPFDTTIGLKQGWLINYNFFYLFINNLPLFLSRH